MNQPFTLTDTRPYPEVSVKNTLLLHASHLAHSTSAAQRKLSSESLQSEILGMLQQNYYLGLSVAMSMAADAPSYKMLLENLDIVLQAHTPNEVQFFAMPLILVAGCNRSSLLPLNVPQQTLFHCLENHASLAGLTQAKWLPFLVSSSGLSNIDAGTWFNAKQDTQAAQNFLNQLTPSELLLPDGQSVHAVFALGYGSKDTVSNALNQNLQQAGLPLMQVWQEALQQDEVTLFVNPLSANTPLHALTEANHMRQRMAMDVFSTNAIRAIRLQSPRVGVVMAAQQGGKLLFGFNATDSAFELPMQIFSWMLSPSDNIKIIQQNFLDLMMECRIENIYMLHDVLPENGSLPNYAQAVKQSGHNPLFSEN